MKATLIISIYKNTNYLKAVLDALQLQTVQDFEIILSEDGQDEPMQQFIDSYPFRQPMQHLTQPDVGWQKNKALNRAIKAAHNPWLIFIDGDCILHPRFIEMHLYYAKPNRILGGKRIKLDQDTSNRLINNPTNQLWLTTYIVQRICFGKGHSKYCDEGIFVDPTRWSLFHKPMRSLKLLKGCNMSFSKQNAELINGFDEDYTKPAIGEDTDLSWRFKGMGLEQFSLRNRAIVYHLNHKETWHNQKENAALQHNKQQQKLYRCLNGLTRYENIQSDNCKK